MRVPFVLSLVAAAALTLAAPLEEVQAQRGGRGGGYGGGRGGSGVSIGSGGIGYSSGGRNGFSIGYGNNNYGYGRSGYGYGNNYGGYGNNYGGYNRGYGYPSYGYGGNYGGYSSGGYYTQPATQYYSAPATYQAAVPYQGSGVAIRNQSNETIMFTVDDSRQMRIQPGDTHRLTEKGKFTVTFDRGSNFGQARYGVHEGLYEFTPTQRGWELFRQKAGVDTMPVRNRAPRDAANSEFETRATTRDDVGVRTNVRDEVRTESRNDVRVRDGIDARSEARDDVPMRPRTDVRDADDSLVPPPPSADAEDSDAAAPKVEAKADVEADAVPAAPADSATPDAGR